MTQINNFLVFTDYILCIVHYVTYTFIHIIQLTLIKSDEVKIFLAIQILSNGIWVFAYIEIQIQGELYICQYLIRIYSFFLSNDPPLHF